MRSNSLQYISYQLGCVRIDRRMQGRKNLYEGRPSNYNWIIINMGIFLRLSIIILIFAIEMVTTN